MKTRIFLLLVSCLGLLGPVYGQGFALSPKSPADIGAAPASVTATVASFSANVPQNIPLFVDDFHRANVTGSLGTAPDGQPYDVTGTGVAQMGIVNNTYTSGALCYASKRINPLVGTVKSISCSFMLTGTTTAGFAMILSADTTLQLKKMLHLTWSPGTVPLLTLWTDATHQNLLPINYTNVSSMTYAVGTVYKMTMTVNGNYVHVHMPDGTSADFDDPLVSQVAGNRGIWELGSTNTAFLTVSLSGATNVPFYGHITAAGGVDGAVGDNAPARGTFSKIAVGAKATGTAMAYVINNGTASQDALELRGDNVGATMTITTTNAGFSPGIYFNQGLSRSAQPRMWVTSGFSFDLMNNGLTRVSMPFGGGLIVPTTFKHQFTSGAGAPTSANINTSECVLWKNTTDGTLRYYCNDGGTIKAGATFN